VQELAGLGQHDAAAVPVDEFDAELFLQCLDTIAIGMPPSVGAVLTVPLVCCFRAEFPEVAMRIVEGRPLHRVEHAAGIAVQELAGLGQHDAAAVPVDEFPRGTIAIGMPPSVGAVLTVPLVCCFRAEFPEVAMRRAAARPAGCWCAARCRAPRRRSCR
jgi:DNA-binding transcriptional LysR family regulator